ncbi:SDR family NAD(P)-dependent oxidoreductase [Devriesea agamarum]|uniref:SDR family NAD(P)-dependent oxidoreductase n=1 Tax=Devriesea agamarum TaxID=472569 RepID=UPI00071D2321|nr:SDR family NAD(P)-dependent oxidoreductase [Devriesea agamarum]
MHRALITGGTSGIGAAFARALARRGVDLVLVARDQTRLDAVASEVAAAYGVHVETMSADLSDRSAVDRVVARIESDHDPVDFFVCNAGFSLRDDLLARDVSGHDLGFEVMVRAVFVLAGAAGRAMSARGRGWIVITSSTSGYVTQNNYSAVKAWTTNYSEALHNRLRGTGVQVTALCPGWVRTEFHARAGISGTSIPSFLWMDPDRVVEECLADVARGKVISIPGRRYKVMIALLRHAPRRLVRKLSAKLSDRRARER